MRYDEGTDPISNFIKKELGAAAHPTRRWLIRKFREEGR